MGTFIYWVGYIYVERERKTQTDRQTNIAFFVFLSGSWRFGKKKDLQQVNCSWLEPLGFFLQQGYLPELVSWVILLYS